MTELIFLKLGGSLITDKTKPYSARFDNLERLAHEIHTVLSRQPQKRLKPKTVLLAGLEAAVWADFPARQQKVDRITPGSFDGVSGRIGGSHGTNVTGGMRSKVAEMLAWCGKFLLFPSKYSPGRKQEASNEPWKASTWERSSNVTNLGKKGDRKPLSFL